MTRAIAAGTKTTLLQDYWARLAGKYYMCSDVVREVAKAVGGTGEALDVAAVRVHQRPRGVMFTPERVKGGMLLSEVHPKRLTRVKSEAGTGYQTVWHELKEGENLHSRHGMQPWTGVTVFFHPRDTGA